MAAVGVKGLTSADAVSRAINDAVVCRPVGRLYRSGDA